MFPKYAVTEVHDSFTLDAGVKDDRHQFFGSEHTRPMLDQPLYWQVLPFFAGIFRNAPCHSATPA
jgi:hypothetical protein